MFAECVAKDAGCLPYVEAMMKNLRAKIPAATKTRCKLARDRCRMLGKAMHRKDWHAVIRQGVDLLGDDPWDITLLRNMAEACAALHLNEVELVYLKQALDAAPDNTEVNRHCAQSLGRMGQFDQAIACWQRVEKLVAKDAEATRMIAFLASEKLKYPGGRPPGRLKISPPLSPESLRNIPHQIDLSPGQTLHTAIVEKPRRLRAQQEPNQRKEVPKNNTTMKSAGALAGSN